MPITLRNTTDAGVPTPASDKVTLFTENDILYIKDDTGATFPVGAGGGGSVTSVNITGNDGLTVSGGPITTSGSITVGLGNITPDSILTVGDISISTPGRITGNWSSEVTAGVIERAYIQSSVPNGQTTVSLQPNGTSNLSNITLENSSGLLTDSAFLSVFNDVGRYGIAGLIRGTGPYLPLHIDNGGVVSVIIDTSGNFNVQTNLTAVGTITGSNLSGTNTGDQTITLTGDVTGSGTGTFAVTLSDTTVTPGAYTNADVTVDSKGRITAIANGSGGGGFTPSILSPLTGQSLVYNTSADEWQNRYLAATFQVFQFSSSGDTGILDGTPLTVWSLSQSFGDGDACVIDGSVIRFLRSGRYKIRFNGGLSVTAGWPDGYTAYNLNTSGSSNITATSSTNPWYYRFSDPGNNATMDGIFTANTDCGINQELYYEVSANATLTLTLRAANLSAPSTLYSAFVYLTITPLDTYNPS